MEIETETHIGTLDLGPNEKQKEGEREQGRQDQKKPSSDDGWRYRQRPTLSTGLSPQGPNEEQKEGDHEKASQDREGYIHPLIQGD